MTCRSDEDKHKILNEFINKLLGGMEDLNPFYSKVVSEKFWELIRKEKEIGDKTSDNSS